MFGVPRTLTIVILYISIHQKHQKIIIKSIIGSYHHSIATMNTSLLWNHDCSELRNVATNAVKHVLMCSNYDCNCSYQKETTIWRFDDDKQWLLHLKCKVCNKTWNVCCKCSNFTIRIQTIQQLRNHYNAYHHITRVVRKRKTICDDATVLRDNDTVTTVRVTEKDKDNDTVSIKTTEIIDEKDKDNDTVSMITTGIIDENDFPVDEDLDQINPYSKTSMLATNDDNAGGILQSSNGSTNTTEVLGIIYAYRKLLNLVRKQLP